MLFAASWEQTKLRIFMSSICVILNKPETAARESQFLVPCAQSLPSASLRINARCRRLPSESWPSFLPAGEGLEGMFDFHRGPRMTQVILDPSTGIPVGGGHETDGRDHS